MLAARLSPRLTAARQRPTLQAAPTTASTAPLNRRAKGQALLDAINSATKSVDIVIYQIGSPDINSALVNAMKRNVKVRVVIDSGSAGNVTKGKAFVTAMNAAIAAASANPALFTANWSSDNFNFTHQKSVMIDAVDSNGATLASGSMPSTAKLLISTGNFLPNVNPPEPFYGARDFYVTTPNQDLINRASLIFTSDFSCAGRTATNNPLPGQSVGPRTIPSLCGAMAPPACTRLIRRARTKRRGRLLQQDTPTR